MVRNEPTLYVRVQDCDVRLDAVTIIKSRFKRADNEGRWWAFRPPYGDEAIHAPTFARVLELAEREWGKGSD